MVKRYSWHADRDFLVENEHGALVLASEYDALTHLYDAEVIALRAAGASHEKTLAENRELREKVAFLESREVCGAAHENVDECGYCQRDKLIQFLNHWADNCDCDCDACRDLSNDIPHAFRQQT